MTRDRDDTGGTGDAGDIRGTSNTGDTGDISDISDSGGTDRRQSLVEELAAQLRATEELPVSAAASPWLGEAHAVAEDLTRGDVDDTVLSERLGHVRRLLESVGATDNEAADERVDAALEILDAFDHVDAADSDEAADDGGTRSDSDDSPPT